MTPPRLHPLMDPPRAPRLPAVSYISPGPSGLNPLMDSSNHQIPGIAPNRVENRSWNDECEPPFLVAARPVVAIVGAGVGGLALAIALQERGVPCRMYEARAKDDLPEIPNALTPNARRALNLISSELKTIYDELSVTNRKDGSRHSHCELHLAEPGFGGEGVYTFDTVGEDIEAHTSFFNRAKLIPLMRELVEESEKARRRRCSAIVEENLTAHPEQLPAEDVEALFENMEPRHAQRIVTRQQTRAITDDVLGNHPEIIMYETRVIDVEQHDGRVWLRFAHDAHLQHSADIVVGCDGAHGVVRTHVLKDRYPQRIMPVFQSRYVYRGILRPSREDGIVSLKILAEEGGVFFGKGYYVVVAPMGKNHIMVIAGKNYNHPWPHLRRKVTVSHEEMMQDFEGCDPQLTELISRLQPVRYALFAHDKNYTYRLKNVAIMGDAAHAMLPHEGTKDGQVFEDALFLSHVISLVENRADIQSALAIYESKMRPRNERLSFTAVECGLIYTLTHERFGHQSVDLVKLTEEFNQRFKWIWNYDHEADMAKMTDAFNALVIGREMEQKLCLADPVPVFVQRCRDEKLDRFIPDSSDEVASSDDEKEKVVVNLRNAAA